MFFLHFNWFDYCLVFVIFLSLSLGFFRGFFREVISLASWIVAFVIAVKFTTDLALSINPYIKSLFAAKVVSFILLFIVVLTIGMVFNYLVKQVIRKHGTTFFDRILGILFGFTRGAVISFLIIFLLSISPLKSTDWYKKSYFTQEVKDISTAIQQQASFSNVKLSKLTKKILKKIG